MIHLQIMKSGELLSYASAPIDVRAMVTPAGNGELRAPMQLHLSRYHFVNLQVLAHSVNLQDRLLCKQTDLLRWVSENPSHWANRTQRLVVGSSLWWSAVDGLSPMKRTAPLPVSSLVPACNGIPATRKPRIMRLIFHLVTRYHGFVGLKCSNNAECLEYNWLSLAIHVERDQFDRFVLMRRCRVFKRLGAVEPRLGLV